MRIISKEILAEAQGISITKLVIEAQDIAQQAKAGQFVVLMVKDEGERIPLTIVEAKPKEGIIALIFQEAGLTTHLLAQMQVGDLLYALVGPLGNPSEIREYGQVILVGGGVGIAEIYPIAKALKEMNNDLTIILGTRTKQLLILEEELKELSTQFYITTDDGTYGRKGLVTDVLRDLLDSSDNYQLVYAVGPIPMMKKVSEITKEKKIKTVVSLNALMVDATGMCGCCRVSISGKTKFSCVDGPEFDAYLVDWEELEKRNEMYLDKERCIYNLLLK